MGCFSLILSYIQTIMLLYMGSIERDTTHETIGTIVSIIRFSAAENVNPESNGCIYNL